MALLTKTEQGAATATGAFTGDITGLAAGTTYHVRAYATNSADTSYGDDVTFTTAAAATSDTWDGSVASGFAGGSGSSGDPYRIATAEQLARVANLVNSETENANYGDKYYRLTVDLDLDNRQWTPIGNTSDLGGTNFKGTFDGDGHTVSNLAIGTAGSPNATFANAGLFGYVYRGTVSDLLVLDVAIYSAGANAGGLVGYWNGTSGIATPVTNCCTTGSISGGSGANVGGLIGQAGYCSISNCFSTCDVTGGENAFAGGLLGTTVSPCPATSCFATGNVTSSGSVSIAGGLIGLMGDATANCYAAGSASTGATYWGGLVGYRDSGSVTGCYYNSTLNTEGAGSETGIATGKISADMKQPAFVVDLNTTGYSGVWEADNGANEGYPVLTAVQLEVTDTAPVVTTAAVTDITRKAATGNGSLTSLGVPNATAYGVCWDTAESPTVSDSLKDLGAATATGAFTAAITGLADDTTYYVRAFAVNSAGTVYGEQVSFTTLEGASIALGDATFITASTYTCGIEMSSPVRMVTISVDSGYFTVPSLGSGTLTFLGGTSGTAFIDSHAADKQFDSAVFSFTDVSGAKDLLSAIVYSPSGTTQQTVTATASTVSPAAGDIYFEGHFYRYVSATVNWAGAVVAAHGLTDPYFGGHGYIATATNQAENSILLKLVDNGGTVGDHWNDAWMGGLWQRNTETVESPVIVRDIDGYEITYAALLGATETQRENMLVNYRLTFVDFDAGNTGTYIYANPGTVKYYWIDGPEAGQEIENNTADFAP